MGDCRPTCATYGSHAFDCPETLARVLVDTEAEEARAISARILASDWLDAVRRKAGDERAEQIAQAIEAVLTNDTETAECLKYAARIARESR